MPVKANWNYPTSIRFGAGRVAELSDALKGAGISKPLLVTDPGVRNMPMLAKVLADLEAAGRPAAVFSDVQANPVDRDVEAGVAAYRAGGHDGVVAFGGGSALDVGKVVAFMVGQTRPLWDFEDIGDLWTRADTAGIAPVIAVPTTAGTGSEVGARVSLPMQLRITKKVIFHPGMMPAVAICDPELTVGLPPYLTAGTGMDALAHCLEAYCAPGYHPMAEGVAVEGMRLVKENLARVVANGANIEARGNMMSAAAMGATASKKGSAAFTHSPIRSARFTTPITA